MREKFYQTANFIAFILCCSIGLVACETSDKSLATQDGQKFISTTFKAQLKISFCAFNIVQIKDSVFFHYGMSWTDAMGKTYKNVFSVKNHCDFKKDQLKVDEIFTCRIVDKSIVDTCVSCMGFMETPAIAHNIELIR